MKLSKGWLIGCISVLPFVSNIASAKVVANNGMIYDMQYTTSNDKWDEVCLLTIDVVFNDTDDKKAYYYITPRFGDLYYSGAFDVMAGEGVIEIDSGQYPPNKNYTIGLSLTEGADPIYESTFFMPEYKSEVFEAKYDKDNNYYYEKTEYDTKDGRELLSYNGAIINGKIEKFFPVTPMDLQDVESMEIENGHYVTTKKYNFYYQHGCLTK